MDADLFRVFIFLAVLIGLALVGSVVFRLHQVIAELKELTAALNRLKGSFPDIATLVRSQQEAIKAARAKEDTSAETALLEDD
jgi:hypothetical protein